MKILIRRGGWAVVADWLGAERVVFSSPDIFECIRFVAAHN